MIGLKQIMFIRSTLCMLMRAYSISVACFWCREICEECVSGLIKLNVSGGQGVEGSHEEVLHLLNWALINPAKLWSQLRKVLPVNLLDQTAGAVGEVCSSDDVL